MKVIYFFGIAVAGYCCAAETQSGPAPTATLDPLLVTADRESGMILAKEELEFFQVDSVADLGGLVPGLAVVTSDSGGYGDIITMRGSANTLFFSPPAVGMVVDDVPMGDVSSYMTGLLAMDSVAVFRGPQGTGYGRNGAAGMIEMTTPGPGREWHAGLSAEYGSYDAFSTRLESSGPLGGGFSHSVQLYYQERDGYIYNKTLNRNTDDRKVQGGLANLYWKPNDSTEWRLRFLMERENDGSQRLSLLDSNNPFEVESDIPGESVIEREQVSLHWTKRGSWGTVKSITAWQDWKLDPGVTDLDLLDTPGYGTRSRIVQDQRMWTQEFRWESPEDSGPWSWRTGVFLMDQSNDGDTMRMLGGPYSERINYHMDQWNLAVYGRASNAVNERLSLTAGARVEFVDSQIDRSKTTNYTYPMAPVHDDMGDWYVSPELGASYSLSESVRLFARSAIGIKPAGFSAFASNPSLVRYDEETAWTNEIGAEITLPDEHVTMSLVGFWNRIHDYQVNRPDLYTTDYFTVNADQVTSFGLEGEVNWQPQKGLTIQGSAGCVNAEFDDYVDPLISTLNYDGNDVPFVSEYTAAIGVRYEFGNGFHAQTSVRISGATWFNEGEDSEFRQGSYATWDAEIGYMKEGFSVAVFARNLLDEEYYTYINPQIKAGSPGDPQCFGIRMNYGF